MNDAFDHECDESATPNLNPAQERAYAAFKDCQRLSPTAQLGEITEAGGLSFTARPGEKSMDTSSSETRLKLPFARNRNERVWHL